MQITKEMDRGVTLFPARGAFSGRQQEVVYCVVGRHEIRRLKTIIRSIDPLAFIVITDVHDVLGEGFKENKPNLKAHLESLVLVDNFRFPIRGPVFLFISKSAPARKCQNSYDDCRNVHDNKLSLPARYSLAVITARCGLNRYG